jgi:hypothetical protein
MLTTTMQPLSIVIFGPYKSGTTGLYTKIANSLSGPIESVFEQASYDGANRDPNAWVLAKTMIWYDDSSIVDKYGTFLDFDKKILLTRDPRDWIISGMIFLVQQERSLYDSDENMRRILLALREKELDPARHSVVSLLKLILGLSEQHDFVGRMEWIYKHYRWLPEFQGHLGDHLLLAYEDFVDERLEQLEAYLGLSLSGSAEVAPHFSHVPRTKAHGNWRSWFTEEDVAFFRPAFTDYLKRYGYDLSWELDPTPKVPRQHCTDYVIMTTNRRRHAPLPPWALP